MHSFIITVIIFVVEQSKRIRSLPAGVVLSTYKGIVKFQGITGENIFTQKVLDSCPGQGGVY